MSEKLKNKLNHLRTIPEIANILASISIALLSLKVLYLNRLPSVFEGAYELGLLVDSVLASIVASYIFYVMVVHLPTEISRDHVRPYIRRHVKLIVGECQKQVADLSNILGETVKLERSSLEKLSRAFALIEPGGEAPLLIFPTSTKANWLSYFRHHINSTESSISKLLVLAQFLDPKLIRLLTSLDDCSHFQVFRLLGTKVSLRNKDMSAWEPDFIEYCEICLELQANL